MFKAVEQTKDFPGLEARILKFWQEAGIFEKSLTARQGAQPYIFFEGPPTANGTPHNGHVLTRVIKDLLPRYKTMRGYLVNRKAGWDTHGLPVEVEVEKSLGIHGKEAILDYGLEAFTRRCIDSVFTYTDVWQELTERIGFWVNLEEAYVTYHKSYVESVWWALKTLFDRGLLYQGKKVVWWWPQGGTALSSAEVGLGYRPIDDPSITVRFPAEGEDNTFFLAWTTTPWTLPSNCALTVRKNLRYAYARRENEVLILAEDLLDKVLGEDSYEVIKTVTGEDLLGRRYQPLFDFAAPEGGDHHLVIDADFVTTSAGTGIVHTAPAFGEDDNRAAMKHGVGLLQLIGPDGKFLTGTGELEGLFCKDADRPIIRNLQSRGLLFEEKTYRHDYPFCWRADDDPLIQYARPAWFIRTTEVIERAKASNQAINWVPGHIKDGRFGDFLDNNVDWALSRERFWGTPLPIWECKQCEDRSAFASCDEIRALNPDAFAHFEAAQKKDPSLSEHLMVHKPWIDAVEVPCESCGGTMHRVPEVIDCWFDSGCMPFAQWGYPHQGTEDFEQNWPADFISEAIDQTRGWFYSLLMVSTLLFEEEEGAHPYKNCIVLGHVCDKKGKKESKSKGNYTPPDAILDSSGADAMRWYFYAANAPWNNTRYSPEAVRQSQQEFLLKLHNVYAFFVIYGNIDAFEPATSPDRPAADRGLLDRWILSELQLTLETVTAKMDAYAIHEAAASIIHLTDALSNWWLRRSRERFWSGEKNQDKWDAYHTLHEVLVTMSRLIAPFVPFLAEELHQNLVVDQIEDAAESVHLCDWPDVDTTLIDRPLSEDMAAVREICSLALSTRTHHKLKIRQPLAMAEVIPASTGLEARMEPYEDLILSEVNIKELRFSQDAGDRVQFEVKPNYRALGPIFGKRMPMLRQALDKADATVVRSHLAEKGSYGMTLEDGETFSLTQDHVTVSVTAEGSFAVAGGQVGTVLLETELTDELIAEGYARELINRIQSLRKEQNLDYVARIRLTLTADDDLLSAARTHAQTICSETLATDLSLSAPPESDAHTSEGSIAEFTYTLGLTIDPNAGDGAS